MVEWHVITTCHLGLSTRFLILRTRTVMQLNNCCPVHKQASLTEVENPGLSLIIYTESQLDNITFEQINPLDFYPRFCDLPSRRLVTWVMYQGKTFPSVEHNSDPIRTLLLLFFFFDQFLILWLIYPLFSVICNGRIMSHDLPSVSPLTFKGLAFWMSVWLVPFFPKRSWEMKLGSRDCSFPSFYKCMAM